MVHYKPKLTNIRFVALTPKNGLLGYCSFILDNNYYVGCVAIFSKRNTAGISLAYPKVNDRECYHPLTKNIGDEIVNQVYTTWIKFKLKQQSLIS